MVTITNGTIDWELSCERYALIGGSPPSGWTVKANTCANYARKFNAPFASFGVGGGDGTVRSVALAADEDIFSVSGSPVTDIGTLILALKEQGAGLVFAGPVSGADGVPTFRVLEATDIDFGSATAGDVWSFNGANWGPEAPTPGYTDEQAQDAVGSILVDSPSIGFTYNDGTPSIVAYIKHNGVTEGTFTKFYVGLDGRILAAYNLSAADIPDLSVSKLTSGTLSVARGGTGLGALGTALQYLRTNAGETSMEWATLTAITGSLTAPRIPVASGAGTLVDYDELRWDNTVKGMRAGAGAGSVVGTYTAYPATGNGFYAFASVSGAVYGTLENFWNAAGAGSAYWIIKVGGASAGDPYVMFVVAGANTWSAGIDNSDNDTFKIGPYQSPGSGLIGLHILTTGEAALGATPNAALAMLFAAQKPLGIPSGTDATRALSNVYGSIHYNNTNQRVEVIGASKAYYQTIASYVAITTTIGAAAGTGATVTPENANEIHGTIRLDTGTGTSAGVLFVINFNTMVSPTIVFFGKSANSAAQLTNIYVSITTPTSLTISCVSALAASNTFRWSYRLDG